MTWPHQSVMLAEVVDAMAPAEGEVHVDCTLGAGGHAAAMLAAAPITLVGLDRDPDAIAIARERLAAFHGRVHLVRARFSDLPQVLADLDIPEVDGVYADLGVSSMQLDRPERGFSFRAAGPLRMTMDPDATQDAATLVNEASEQERSAERTGGTHRRQLTSRTRPVFSVVGWDVSTLAPPMGLKARGCGSHLRPLGSRDP